MSGNKDDDISDNQMWILKIKIKNRKEISFDGSLLMDSSIFWYYLNVEFLNK